MGSTNVPQPTFGATGFVAPAESDILAGVQADWQSAFGGTLNFTNPSAPQGQMATSQAAIIAAVFTTFTYFTNQVDPAYAQGRMQDAIGRIYFIERLPAIATTLSVNCGGANGVIIPFGAIVFDSSNNQYSCTQIGGGTISGGSITLPFSAVLPGPTAVPSGSLSIYQSINGWDSASVAYGAVGRAVETRAEFELRRQQSVAQNALGSLPAVLGSLLSVDNLTDAYVIDNPTNAPVTINGQTIAANSIYCAAVGGADLDVATAIWKKKMPGCPMTGNMTISVTDPNAIYQTPPTYTILFERPTALPILVAVNIATGPSVPSNATALIQAAVVSAFNGGDGGLRARIGQTVFATRFVSAIAALGPWALVRSIQVGSSNIAAAAAFTASMAGNVMTVTAVSSGAIAVGQVVQSAGVPDGAMIIALGTGTGGTGTYMLGTTQTVSSAAMHSYAAASNSAAVQINQTPTINAADIYVTVT